MDDDSPRPSNVDAFTDHACAETWQAPDEGSARLLSLRHGAAYLSGLFQLERAALPEAGQARVNSMIEMFFQPGVGTHSQSSSPTSREMLRYDCEVGTIFYFRSREFRAPVLQCFHLHGPGGGGGSAVILPFLPRSPDPVHVVDESGYCERRIAARFDHRLLGLSDKRLVARSQLRRLHRSRGRAKGVGDRNGSATERTSLLGGYRLVCEIADSCRAIGARTSPASLPAWSLLAGQVKVAEQLDNDFAREIFAGEAISHLGIYLSGVRDRWTGASADRESAGLRGAAAVDALTLYQDTLCILRSIEHACARDDWKHCRSFLSLNATSDDLMADIRRLSAIRGEIVLQFTLVLADYSRNDGFDLYFRYAKLAEFVKLSNSYFAVDNKYRSHPICADDYGEIQVTGNIPFSGSMETLDQYGYLSGSIAAYLVEDSSDKAAGSSDCTRLSALASLILLHEERCDGDRIVSLARQD